MIFDGLTQFRTCDSLTESNLFLCLRIMVSSCFLLHKMAAIVQMTFWNEFCWKKNSAFSVNFPWCPIIIWAMSASISSYTALLHYPDSKIHGANMGPTWGRQDPGGAHGGHVNLSIWIGHALTALLLWSKQYLLWITIWVFHRNAYILSLRSIYAWRN